MRRVEELAWASTPIGEIVLRRRLEPTLLVDVYEVRLGEEYLMSSLFTVSEVALAELGLAAVPPEVSSAAQGGLDVVVGGLGLGWTARTVLQDPRVTSMVVVEALGEVISWQRDGLLPGSDELVGDPRTRLVEADFFALARGGAGFDPERPGSLAHAVLLDVDHTPDHVLHPSHADLYTVAGLRRLSRSLHPGGVFALWSDDPPAEAFTAMLRQVFTVVDTHVVEFDNFHTGGRSACSVYVAR